MNWPMHLDPIEQRMKMNNSTATGHLARVQRRNKAHEKRLRAAATRMTIDPMFAVYDYVYKPEGYDYEGTVVAVFRNLKGEWRYVVENGQSAGMLHIFNGDQLRSV